MRKQDQKTKRSSDKTEAPHWLTAALHLTGDAAAFESLGFEAAESSESFRMSCRQAAAGALAILRLRRERQRIGFSPVSLPEYLQGLVKVAGVSLNQALTSIGVRDFDPRGPKYMSALGRLAQAIGMSFRETLTHLRIDFAAQRQTASINLLVAHRAAGDPRRSQLEDCESVLLQIESEYDSKSLRELQSIEQMICEAYQGAETGRS